MILNEPFEPKPEEVAEARRLVAELRSRYDALKIGDRRYVTSLTEYLERLGDQTVWGAHRLALLRKVHGEYCAAESEVTV
ncbi:MAG: hypothetical protein HOP19_01530 [Acidobacteria bacterium]|nr:hypothetical protein [Acidobacteriota bacterium]